MQYLRPIMAIVAAFLIGSIPTAYLMGRLRGVDIRKYGSGNVGATNVSRVLGKKWGFACLFLDILKGWIPTRLLFPFEFFAMAVWPTSGAPTTLWQWVIGIAAILGHMFSPFLKFRGGKGVATSLGVVLAVVPVPMSIALAAAVLLIWLSGYVSLGSIVGATLLPPLVLIFEWSREPWPSFVIALLLALVIVWKHRPNIRRLRQGNEKRWFERVDVRDAGAGSPHP